MSRALVVLAAGLFGLVPQASAQDDVAAFFKDKTLRIVVGVAVGSGYDINARSLARHWSKQIPGKPSIIVQNQPGAGGMTMTATLINSGPYDGTVIGAPFNGTPTTILLQSGDAHIDISKLAWLGSTNRETHVTYVWHTSPVQSLDEARTKELITGAQAPGTTQFDFPAIANTMGYKFKIVTGYGGTPQIHAAMESGEVHGNGATSWTTLKVLNANWLAEKKVKVIAQWTFNKHSDLPDVPLALEIAKTEADRQVMRFVLSRLEYGRPFFLPPGVPAARVTALRRAFDATMKDAEFLAEADKLKLDIDPITGEKVAELVAEASATPAPILAKVKAALDVK